MRHSLIYFFKLDKLGYCCSFGNRLFHLTFESRVVGDGILRDGLYRLNVGEPVSFHTEFSHYI